MFLFLLILALRTDSLQLSCALFLQGHLHLAQVGSNATVHLLKSRRSYTWWPSTTDLAGRLWVVIKVTEQCVINATQFLWSPNHAHYAVLHFWFLFFLTSILYSKMYFSFFSQGETESVTLKSCLRKTTDMFDRRFCLDLDITDRYIIT